MFKNNLKRQSPKNTNHKLYIYILSSRKRRTEYMGEELVALNGRHRKDLWIQFLHWWHKPKPLVLQKALLKTPDLQNFLKWQFLGQPNFHFPRVFLTLPVLLPLAWGRKHMQRSPTRSDFKEEREAEFPIFSLAQAGWALWYTGTCYPHY